MGKIIKIWCKNTGKIAGVLFGLLGAVAIFVPLPNVTSSNIWQRILILGLVIAGIIIASVIYTYYIIHKRSNNVYKHGNTKVYFEYADIKDIIKKGHQTKDITTIVVPINTKLDTVFDVNVVIEGTIHRLALDQLLNGNEKPNRGFIDTIKKKKDGFDPNGRVGDWFIISGKDFGRDGNIQFAFVEVYDIIEENGQYKNVLTKEQFLIALQSVIYSIENESKAYIPLIGDGAGRVGDSRDLMHIMYAMLLYNRNLLNGEVHVVIHEKKREDTPIYELSEF